MSQAKTIQIFLPDGSARSIRIAEITSRNVQAILIPRNKIKEAEKRKEINAVGIYFLFGEDEEKAKAQVYIGEAENCFERIKQHDQSKDFWNIVIAISSKTASFTKAHVKFLEWYGYDLIRNNPRFSLINSVIPQKPYIPETIEADLMDNFETMKILLSTLGYPIFELNPQKENENIIFCKGKGIEAKGQYIDDGLLVFKGSPAQKDLSLSSGSWIKNLREKLQRNGVLILERERLIFSQDYLFNSPSAASGCVLGRKSNGWTAWRDQNGKTLDELKRA